MKVVICIIIYNRFNNLEHWLRCWKLCYKKDINLVVIHNFDKEEDKLPYKELCEENSVIYISRPNIGMDIGAFQDVCKGRILEFPEWTHLFWVTDDTLPMNKDFITPFISGIHAPNMGVVCLELSNEVKMHIRTTGFLITKEVANKLLFPADPVLTRSQCYEFEHRARNAFYEQVKNMRKDVAQVHRRIERSYLWDTHNRARFNRWDEYYKEFPR